MTKRKRRRILLAGSSALGVTLAALIVAAAAIPGTTHVLYGGKTSADSRSLERTARSVQAQSMKRALANQGAAAQLPQSVIDQLSDLANPPAAVPDAARPGRPVVTQARALLTNVGVHKATLYGVPTGKGELCAIYSVAYGAFGCVATPEPGAPIQWGVGDLDAIGSGDPPFVEGLAPSDVTAIEVLAGTASWSAKLANGAFFFQLPGADMWPTALQVTRTDGSSDTVSISPPPTAEPAP